MSQTTKQTRMTRFGQVVVFLFVCGCTKTVTRSALDAKASEHAGFTFPDNTYYIGSEGSYDYFVVRSGLDRSTRKYRVMESEGVVTNRFP